MFICLFQIYFIALMIDQMKNQVVHIVISWLDYIDGGSEDEDEKMIDIFGDETNLRPVYLIKRTKKFFYVFENN